MNFDLLESYGTFSFTSVPNRYVTELSSQVQVLEGCSVEDGFLLPEFVWCLRDVASDSCWEDMLLETDNNMDTILPSSTSALPLSSPPHFLFSSIPPLLTKTEFTFSSLLKARYGHLSL